MTNLAELLERSAAAYPDRTAIVFADTRLSYAQVNAAANQVANMLVDAGVRPGDNVAFSCPNLPYFPIVYYGILKMGAVVVTLNVLFKGREIAYHLADSEATAYIAFEGTSDLPISEAGREGFLEVPSCASMFVIPAAPSADPPWSTQPASFTTVERDDDDTAVILYTSGTTGQPKGAELRHSNLRSNALLGAELFDADPERPDTYLCVLPLFHSYGQSSIQNGAFAFGGTIALVPRFEAKPILDLMRRERVTFLPGVPTMYWGLLAALDDSVDVPALAANLRVAVSGGAPLPAEIHEQFRQRFGVTILEGYGLSETSPAVSFSRFGEDPRVGSIGVPVPGVEMKLIHDDWTEVPDSPDAVGEIAIRGHNVMKGYYRRPEATAEAIRDGWFRSGDLARRDDDGFYYIVDRAKDMIIRGGFNVYPREIEEALMEHPAVSLVAVIGVPHESHGEEIKAVILRNDGHQDVGPDEIVDWSRNQLAAYKYPRIVEFVDQLPMTSTGKILKRALR